MANRFLIGRIDRYITVTVLAASLGVLLALLGIMCLFALVEELSETAAGYSLPQAAWYVFLTIPRRTVELMPYVVFLGSLIGMGTLASNSEVVVLRAAGVSPWRIFLSLSIAAFLLLAVGVLLAEVVAPAAEQQAEIHKTRHVQGSGEIAFEKGYWYREGALYMNVDGLAQDGGLSGVKQYWFDDDRQLLIARSAKRGEYVTGADAHWRLLDVIETRFAAQQVSTQQLAEVRWDSNVDARLMSIRAFLDPQELPLVDLSKQIDYLEREGLVTNSYELAYWTKILQPLSVLGLSLLALSFILGPLRELSMGVRISVGILAGLVYKYLQDLFAPMGLVYDWPAFAAVGLPILICWIIGYFGLRRVA